MLRTLTLKSRIGFGKYSDYLVSEVIEIFDKGNYIVWCYYSLSNISFHDEILKSLGVDCRINKPGKQPELFDEFMKKFPNGYNYKELDMLTACKLKNKSKSRKKRQLTQADKLVSFPKERLQHYNRKQI